MHASSFFPHFLLLLIPQVVDSVTGLVKTLPGQIDTAWNKIQNWLENEPEIYEYWSKYATEVEERINNWIKTGLPTTARKVLNGAIGGVYDTVTVFKNVLLGMIVSIYILARRKQMAAQGKLLIKGLFKPRVASWIEKEIHFIDRMFNGFFTGKVLDSAIIGLLCFIGCLILRLQPALLIAVIVGVTNKPVFKSGAQCGVVAKARRYASTFCIGLCFYKSTVNAAQH